MGRRKIIAVKLLFVGTFLFGQVYRASHCDDAGKIFERTSNRDADGSPVSRPSIAVIARQDWCCGLAHAWEYLQVRREDSSNYRSWPEPEGFKETTPVHRYRLGVEVNVCI